MTKALFRLAAAALALGGPAYAQTIWAVDNLGEFNGGTVGDRVITFDVSNPAVVTVIGATGVPATLMGGADFGPGGTLYCYAQVTGGALYTVNQGNGMATLVGSGGAGGDTISDITYSATDGKMYGIGLARGGTVNLYEINLVTGMASVNAAITDPTGTMLNIGLAVDPTNNDLYVLDLVTDFVFRRVGSAWVALPNPVGFNANFSQGMNCDSSGALYLGALNNDSFRTELRSVNTTTGVSAFLGFIGGVNPNGLPEYETGDIAFEPSASCGTVYCDTNPDNGADISISGCDCSSGSIVVSLSNAPVPDGNNAYLLVGASNGVSTNPPGATGDLCLIGSPIGRYIADISSISGGGASTDILNALTGGGGGNLPTPPGGNVCSPSGQSWNFQYWHRDGMSPSRFSKAIAVTFN